MSPVPGKPSLAQLAEENATLRERLQEAEATLSAISSHGVDAFIVNRDDEERVLVLDGVDRPYRMLIERMHQAAVTITSDGTIIYSNSRLSDLLCVPANLLPGARFADHVIPEDWPRLARLLEQGLTGDSEIELRVRSKDEMRPVHITISILSEAGGLACLIVTDLTQQKRAEEERRRHVSERAAAEAATAILRETNRRKDEFLAMLAHELRGPLGPIRNGIEILNRVSSKEPAVQQIRDMMHRQTESLVRLVDDLLDAARVTQGKIGMHLERADLRDVVRRAIEGSRLVVDQRVQSLEISLPADPVMGNFDGTRLGQVVINLLNNAVKFSPQDSIISLTLECSTPNEATIRVKDAGIGIDPELLPKIFDLFAQANASASRAEGGLGIGLTLARRLVEMHGGSLVGHSDGVGEGSEFVIRLPLSRDDGAPEGPPAAPVPDLRDTRYRVLIVDDNRDSAESLAQLLRVMGQEVRQIHEGKGVTSMVREFAPDLVLLDIGLPGMDGYQVAGALRADPSIRNLRIVAVSGYGSEEHRTRARVAGFDDHMVKPVEAGRLEALIASLAPVRSSN